VEPIPASPPGGEAEAAPVVRSRANQGELVNLTRAAETLVQGRNFEAGISAAKQVLKRDERFVPAMIVMARAYYHLGKVELSTAICDIAKKIEPGYAETYFVLGLLALKADNRPGALAAFRKAVELKSDFAAAWNNLGAQYLAAKNYSEAATAFGKAADLSPQQASIRLNRGSAFRGNQEYKRAENEYLEAARLQSGYADAYFNLGILYLDAQSFPGYDIFRRLDLSIQNFQRYIQLKGSARRRDDPAEGYIDEARKQIDREQKAKLRAASGKGDKKDKGKKDDKAKPAGKGK
jgi:tetratricopeptide (TPR) repeat protein